MEKFMTNVRQLNQKVMAWGTFDILHEGHIEFLKTAATFGELCVVIGPDEIVMQNKARAPDDDQETRRKKVEALPFVKSAVIDAFAAGLPSAERFRPDVFCLGYDQSTQWEERLAALFRGKQMQVRIVRLEQYANGIHSRHIKAARSRKLGS